MKAGAQLLFPPFIQPGTVACEIVLPAAGMWPLTSITPGENFFFL